MNRLTNYFASAKLAQMHIKTALEANAAGNPRKAIRHLIEAFLNLQCACNNIASIAFNSKPKKRGK